MADGKVVISTKLDNKGFEKGLSGMQGSVSKLAGALGAAFSIAVLINYGKAAVQTASQMRSAFTGLQSIIEGQGRSVKEAKAFIQDYISDGLVPATNAVTAYKNLAMRGYDDKQIQEVMVALKNSSAYGRSAALTMGESISSATEGLKNENSILVDNAGVTKNVSMMWKDYAKTIGVGVDSLTQQQKIQAEVNGILHETRFQTGDAAKVAGEYEGQLLGLKFALNDFKIALGNVLIPINQYIIPAFKSLVNAATRVMNAIAQISSALFGTAAKRQQQVADSAGAAADAEGDLAQATKEAGKAAKGSLGAFDELNVLQKETATGTSPDIGAGSGAIVPDVVPPDTEELPDNIAAIVDKIRKLMEPIQAISLDNLAVAFGRLEEAVAPINQALFAGLEWAWYNLLVPLAQWTIEDAAPVVVDTLAAAFDYFSSVLAILTPIAAWIWDNFLVPLGKWVADSIIEAIKMIQIVLQRLAQWLADNKDKMLGVFSAIAPLLKSIGDFIIKQFDRIKDLLFALYQAIVDIMVGVMDFIMGVFAGDWEQVWSGLVLIVKGVFNAVLALFLYMWEYLYDAFIQGVENIKIILLMIGGWIYNAVIVPIADYFVGLWNSITRTAKACWDRLESIWKVVADWFNVNVVQPVQYLFTALWDNVKAIFTSVWDWLSAAFKDYINGWIGLVEGFANMFVRAINKIIESINSISIELPDWEVLGDLAGLSFGFSLPNIPELKLPRLATGAVIPANREFMAVLGDQKRGTNIEAPADLIRQIVREESGSQPSDDKPIAVNLVLDGDIIYRAMVDRQKRQGYKVGGAFANAY